MHQATSRFRPSTLSKLFHIGLLPLLLIGRPSYAALHDLDAADQSPAAHQIRTDTKQIQLNGRTFKDAIFRDGLGREAVFRGWNVSGSTKLAESGFKPFRTLDDARSGLSDLRARSGANVIRLLVAWEAIHTAPDRINTAYLDDIAKQIEAATERGMHVLLDYHQDLYSRFLFNPNSWHTGNGAPQWIITGGNYPAEYCGIICVSWAQHNLTDEAVRRAFRNFWNNAPVNTSAGWRKVQDSYLWQLTEAMRYLRNRLPATVYDKVLGLDPLNEPVDGGMEGLSAKDWDNRKLWPFYERVRQAMDAAGWVDKPVFAEPLVFWNSTVGIVAPATGGRHLKAPPGGRFVFNPHFYDGGRQGIDLRAVNNGTYLTHFEEIREESRFWQSPPFVSEFGMILGQRGRKDTNRTIKAMYQGMEVTTYGHAKDRFIDAYAPVLSGTQWQWDRYYGQHHEVMNGNPAKIQTAADAWNNEDYSVMRYSNGQLAYNIDRANVERIYPRRSQGDIVQFHFNALVKDADGKTPEWAMLKLAGKEWLHDHEFALLVWQGRKSDAPTEVFLPARFDPARTIAISDMVIRNGLPIATAPSQVRNEILLVRDIGAQGVTGAGFRVMVWDDPDGHETADSWHFLLLVPQLAGEVIHPVVQGEWQRELNRLLAKGKTSVVYLTGSMTDLGYPSK
ncbi:cellulase family glycosylhydrolase [Chitinivorax sp. B]|uniref:cellulase family glycosylhydrolase n=1 Tax=Chitinivorax sp. B TaxID=2502235 RepID=UPI0010F69ED4|nr:cellulase family glycosylhydrolase [Chitinivorax sp. B]